MTNKTIIRELNLYLKSGFTLVEVTLVLLVVTILLGYTVGMYPVQQEVKQYKAAELEMDSIIQHILFFAEINGRLPCPDTSANGATIDGVSDVNGATGECQSIYAFLPAKSLGLQGNYDLSNRLLDPWGKPYQYGVSNGIASGNAADDFTHGANIKSEYNATGSMNGDIFVCDNSSVLGAHTTCADALAKTVMSRVAAVVISTGKDRGTSTSLISAENLDNFNNAATTDHIYVYTSRSDVSGAEYDDLINWVPTNLLLSRLIAAKKIP